MKAPDFTLKQMFTDDKTSLADLKGKAVLLTFWVSWCPDSLRDLINKQHLYQAMNTDELAVIMIHVTGREHQEGAGESFYKEHGFTIPVMSDEGTKIYDAYRCMSVPATFILDKYHNVAASFNDQATFRQIASHLSAVIDSQ